MVYTIGETVYDIIFRNGRPVEGKVGGSMLNTSISLGRADIPVAFVSATGTDQLGSICMDFLSGNKVDTSLISRYDGKSLVALAFLDSNNNASYIFHEDRQTARQLSLPVPNSNDIVLFGSLFSLDPFYCESLVDFLNKARQNGSLIIYDPNFRTSLLPQLHELLPVVRSYFALADIIKGSDEDFAHLLNKADAKSVYAEIAPNKDKMLIYTANKDCVEIINGDACDAFEVPPIAPVSTIGAGDTFSAGVIFTLMEIGIGRTKLPEINHHQTKQIADTAIRFAQHVCLSIDNYISHGFVQTLKH